MSYWNGSEVWSLWLPSTWGNKTYQSTLIAMEWLMGMGALYLIGQKFVDTQNYLQNKLIQAKKMQFGYRSHLIDWQRYD